MGQLYGSVSSRDIAASINEAGHNVNRNQVVLDKPLKTLGITDIRVFLHPEVSVTIQINIARSEEEAEAQARGEDVLARGDDAFDDEDVVDNEILTEQSATPEEILEGGLTTAADVSDENTGGTTDNAEEENI